MRSRHNGARQPGGQVVNQVAAQGQSHARYLPRDVLFERRTGTSIGLMLDVKVARWLSRSTNVLAWEFDKEVFGVRRTSIRPSAEKKNENGADSGTRRLF